MQLHHKPLLCSLAFSAAASVCAAQSKVEHLSVVTWSDLVVPLPGIAVLAQSGSTEALHVSGEDSHTEFFDLPAGDSTVVYLGETRYPEGSSVGQALEYFPDADDEGGSNLLQYFQPLALRAFLSSEQEASAEPFHSRWQLSPTSNATYGFAAEVTVLLTPEIIDRYFAYHGLLPPRNYEVGLLMRMGPGGLADGHHSFGTGDALLSIAADAYLGSDVPEGTPLLADVVHVAPSDTYLGASQLSVPVAFSGIGTAWLGLAGTPAVGDTLLLLDFDAAPDEQGVSYDMVSAAPDLELLGRSLALSDNADDPGDFQESGTDGDVTDCKPKKPKAPSEPTCDPDPPKDGKDWSKVGGRSCTYEVVSGGPAECDDPNPNPVQHKWCFEIEGGVSIGLKLSFGGSKLEAEVSGKTKKKYCLTLPVEFHEGNGCGECVQMFFHVARCTQKWKGKVLTALDPGMSIQTGITVTGYRDGGGSSTCVWVDGPWERTCPRKCD